jgi:hypothetical protein
MNSGIVIYQSENLSSQMEVRIEDETVWLTQLQMAELFQTTRNNITLHIGNVFREKELNEDSTSKDYLLVQEEGGRKVKRKVRFFNLDVIISVGYRVKSVRGTQFRIWANGVLKDYLLKGYAIHHRMENLEKKVNSIELKNNEFDLILRTNLPANQGVFYDGQVFDAHAFVVKIIKSAKKAIFVFDNYVDETVLTQLSNRNKGVKVVIYSKNMTKQLKLDLERFNKQYEPIEVVDFDKAHDRFLIVDRTEVYHLGASLKDLGKKWFAFSKLNIDVENLLGKL